MTEKKQLSRNKILIMAVSAGVCVANIYYNQPILKDIARTFKTSESDAGIVSVMAQAGYGLGLFFITPLGDKINRKKLILLLQALLIAALVGMCFITHLAGIYMMNLMIGVFAVATQVLLPMAAALDSRNTGRTVGIIFTGILIGILAARVFSGYITGLLGWRYVYGISAVLVFITSVMVHFFLPDVPVKFSGDYRQLLQSTLAQVSRFVFTPANCFAGCFGVWHILFFLDHADLSP